MNVAGPVGLVPWQLLAEVLRQALPQVQAVARALTEARPDARGLDWAERAGLVHRALARELEVVEALLAAARRDDHPGAGEGPGPVADPAGPRPPGGSAGRAGRARLGATSGERVDPELGARIATLPGDAG